MWTRKSSTTKTMKEAITSIFSRPSHKARNIMAPAILAIAELTGTGCAQNASHRPHAQEWSYSPAPATPAISQPCQFDYCGSAIHLREVPQESVLAKLQNDSECQVVAHNGKEGNGEIDLISSCIDGTKYLVRKICRSGWEIDYQRHPVCRQGEYRETFQILQPIR